MILPTVKKSPKLVSAVLGRILAISTLILPTVTQAEIEYGLAYLEADHSYRVWARSDRETTGLDAMVSSAQVSIMIPLSADIHAQAGSVISGVTSMGQGLWKVNSWNGSNRVGHAGQTEHPTSRVLSVGQLTAGARIEFSKAGEKIALFSFSLSGCSTGQSVRLVNNQDAPEGLADAITAIPNSVGSSTANNWASIMGEQYRNNDAKAALGLNCK